MPSESFELPVLGVEKDLPLGDFQKSIDEEVEEIKKKEAEEIRKKEVAKRKQKLFWLVSKSDTEALRKEAQKEGLIDDDVRSKAWPLLLGLRDMPHWEPISTEELESHPEYNQVVLDVNRSLKRFPPSIEDAKRIAFQDELIVTIVTILSRNPGLHYYQGFHDVAVTILLVVQSNIAGHIIEKISTEHLRPFLEPTMERTSQLLEYIYPLLKKIDHDLFQHLDSSNVGTVFCLPWFITWFSHTLEVYSTLVRLFDYFLAYDHKPGTEFLLPLYLVVCIIESWREELLKQDCEMASIHSFFYKPLDTLDFEALLMKADRYHNIYPPESLKMEVVNRIKDREERLKREDCERKAERERRLKRKAPKTPWLNRLTVWTVAGAVVLISSMYLVRVKTGTFHFSIAQISTFLRNQSYLWTLRREIEEN